MSWLHPGCLHHNKTKIKTKIRDHNQGSNQSSNKGSNQRLNKESNQNSNQILGINKYVRQRLIKLEFLVLLASDSTMKVSYNVCKYIKSIQSVCLYNVFE